MARKIGCVPILLCVGWMSLAPKILAAHEVENVWFSPDGDSPDMVDLFRQPELWKQARGHVRVFKFGPMRLTAHNNVKRNSFEELKDVDAFRKLHAWGIKIASEEGAIKAWDCTGSQAAKTTGMHMRNVRAAGGAIDIIALDEPLSSGRQACHLPDVEVARRTAAYVRKVESSDEAKAQGLKLSVGDIEPYPSVSVEDLEKWTDYLIASGFKPAFVHIDVNGHFVDVHPGVKLERDLQSLQAFFRQKNIPFGVILWSGYSPLNSDRAYYDHTMKFTRAIKKAVGRPDEIIFQSWIKRSTKNCQESDKACGMTPCSQEDPAYCGEKSIPLNLPESDIDSYSHTRLINDALAELERK